MAVDDREEVRRGHIEERTSGEGGQKSRKYAGCPRKERIREIKAYRRSKREEEKGSDLELSLQSRFLENGRERQGDGDLVECYSKEDTVPEGIGYAEPCPYAESVKERVDENRNRGHERDVIVVLVRIFVRVIFVRVIVPVVRQKLFHEVDDEETADKSIDGQIACIERFCQYMHERDREHGTGSEGNQQIEGSLIHLPEKIQNDSGRRDEKKGSEREEKMHGKRENNSSY